MTGRISLSSCSRCLARGFESVLPWPYGPVSNGRRRIRRILDSVSASERVLHLLADKEEDAFGVRLSESSKCAAASDFAMSKMEMKMVDVPAAFAWQQLPDPSSLTPTGWSLRSRGVTGAKPYRPPAWVSQQITFAHAPLSLLPYRLPPSQLVARFRRGGICASKHPCQYSFVKMTGALSVRARDNRPRRPRNPLQPQLQSPGIRLQASVNTSYRARDKIATLHTLLFHQHLHLHSSRSSLHGGGSIAHSGPFRFRLTRPTRVGAWANDFSPCSLGTP